MDSEAVIYSAKIEGGKVTSKAYYNSVVDGKNTIKFDGNVWKGSFDVSYCTEFNQIVLMPTIGISYEKAAFNATKHVNFNVDKTSLEKFSITPGIKIAKSFDLGMMQATPAIFASTTYSPFIESSKIIVKSNNGFVLSEGTMPIVENSYNVGASISFTRNNVDVGLGYERIIQDRYQGQVGYVKLRVNF